ncbi:prevent-host-death protein [Gallintestinimicrobium sp.]|uniref:prevent-host-death protein n=1 Tax=Gallintestinimicrobium sp. TaxID=2981655 RepID=UPI00399470F5
MLYLQFQQLAIRITVLRDAAVGTPVFLTKNGRGRYAILDMQDFEKTQATIRLMNELAKGRSENLSLTGLAQSYSLTNNS